MNIKELATLGESAPVEFKALIADSTTLLKRDKTPYLQLLAQDSTGSIEFPVWSDYEKRKEALAIGVIVKVAGTLTFYEKKPQIKDPVFSLCPADKVEDYILRYNIPEELFTYFDDVVASLDERHKLLVVRATGAMQYSPAKWKEFISCPAAKGYHHAAVGGLFLHTVGLMKNAESILSLYQENPFFYKIGDDLNRSRFLTKVILHDIGKPKEYLWKTGISRKKMVRDHIVMGCAIVEEFAGSDMTEEEVDDICASILTHHGNFDNCKYGRAEIKTIEDQLLHLVDMIDSNVVKVAEGKPCQ